MGSGVMRRLRGWNEMLTLRTPRAKTVDLAKQVHELKGLVLVEQVRLED